MARFHGLFSSLEDLGFIPRRLRESGWGHLYTMLVVVLGFTLFRAESLESAALILSQMFTGFDFTPEHTLALIALLNGRTLFLLACALLFDIKVVIYCIIYSAASSLALDKTHTQNISTEVFIFTKEDPQRVMAYILTDLVRGVTYWEAKGGYTNQDTNIIFTVISKHELSALKHKLRQVDPAAFLVSKENVGIEGKFEKHLS